MKGCSVRQVLFAVALGGACMTASAALAQSSSSSGGGTNGGLGQSHMGEQSQADLSGSQINQALVDLDSAKRIARQLRAQSAALRASVQQRAAQIQGDDKSGAKLTALESAVNRAAGAIAANFRAIIRIADALLVIVSR
jgi:hypothetical protein